MTRIRFHPAVERELAQAVTWYEARSATAGAGFQSAFERALEFISQNPEAAPHVRARLGDHDARRVLLRRYPYAVVYVVRPPVVFVVAIAHCKRRPLYWMHRLGA